MAERDPNLPQSADPELQADLVRLLQVQGPLGMLNVLDIVIPTVSMGQVVPLDVEVRQPVFRSTDIFSIGNTDNPGAGTVLADTGQLAAGIYDCRFLLAASDQTSFLNSIDIEHRNAANGANLAVWPNSVRAQTLDVRSWDYALAYEIGNNERLRCITVGASAASRAWSAVIFARRRT